MNMITSFRALCGCFILLCFSACDPPLKPMPPEQLRDLQQKAENGDTEAQIELGILYAEGRIVRQSYSDAARWWNSAAIQGSPAAQSNLAHLYDLGKGVPQDYKMAAEWYLKSANQGFLTAQFNLGGYYSKGVGVSQNQKEAVKWWALAAAQGDLDSQYNLGKKFKSGEGVEKDLIMAYALFDLASADGSKDALRERRSAASSLTDEQIANARRQLQEWMRTNALPEILRSDISADSLLMEESKLINAALPMMIHEGMRLDSTMAGPGNRVTFLYTFVNLTTNDLVSVNLTEPTEVEKQRLINGYRTKAHMAVFRENQVEIHYLYRDKNGNTVSEIIVSPEDF